MSCAQLDVAAEAVRVEGKRACRCFVVAGRTGRVVELAGQMEVVQEELRRSRAPGIGAGALGKVDLSFIVPQAKFDHHARGVVGCRVGRDLDRQGDHGVTNGQIRLGRLRGRCGDWLAAPIRITGTALPAVGLLAGLSSASTAAAKRKAPMAGSGAVA